MVYRVARGFDPFAPPDWAFAKADGTFGNRFDDPGAYRGIPQEKRFRVIYCASEPAGAFGETVARFRKNPRLLAKLQQIEDSDSLDPEIDEGGVIPEDFRLKRSIGATRLSDTLLFADFRDGETLTILGRKLATWLERLGLDEIDLSTITSSHRRLTQEASRYVYESSDSGQPVFAGIRYASRLHADWDLWAIFHDRMVHAPEDIASDIREDDPELQKAAEILGLRIEE
jgi:RES domain